MNESSGTTVGEYLAPGIRGHIDDRGEEGVFFSRIFAIEEGVGYLAAFLDGLPSHRHTVFVEVIDSQLERLLGARGFTSTIEEVEGRKCSVLSRQANHVRSVRGSSPEIAVPEVRSTRNANCPSVVWRPIKEDDVFSLSASDETSDGELSRVVSTSGQFLDRHDVIDGEPMRRGWRGVFAQDCVFRSFKEASTAAEWNGGVAVTLDEARRMGLIETWVSLTPTPTERRAAAAGEDFVLDQGLSLAH